MQATTTSGINSDLSSSDDERKPANHKARHKSLFDENEINT